MFPYIVLAWIASVTYAFYQGTIYCHDKYKEKQLQTQIRNLQIDKVRYQNANKVALEINEKNETIIKVNRAIIDELREQIETNENQTEPSTNICDDTVLSRDWLRKLDQLR